jgi:hypothetical protein
VPAGADLERDDPTVAWPAAGWDDAEQRLWRETYDAIGEAVHDPRTAAHALVHSYYDRGPHQGSSPSAWQRLMRRCWLYDEELNHALEAQLAAAAVEQARRPGRPSDEAEVRRIGRGRGLARLYNCGGRWVIGQYTVSIWTMTVDFARSMTMRYELYLLAIAAKLYLERHGRVPATLDELVGDGLLTAVPLDPEDGGPLRYEPRHGVVFCVRGMAHQAHGEGQAPYPTFVPLPFLTTKEAVETATELGHLFAGPQRP